MDLKKEIKKSCLWTKSFFSEKKNISNIYHGTIQKTGSQWIKSIFNDPRIKEITGLEVYPQYRYEAGDFVRKFPLNTFVPGLYISPILYREIEKPANYRTFYIIRDPRNIVVSWYYSMKETHVVIGNVGMHRNILNELSFEEGLSYCIEYLSLKFCYMRNWYYESNKDEKIKIFKFEDLIDNPSEEFYQIFKHCKINIDKKYLEEVLKDYTKEKMRKRDLKNKESSKSHYRRKSSKWERAFSDKHIRLFKDVNGNLVNLLGYKE